MRWVALAVVLAGCSGLGERPDYSPGIGPGDFVEGISNPWLPLHPGAYWVYEAGDELIEVRVLHETRNVNGVTATVVRDTVRERGELVEDTWDWFAEDRWGNVWYLGEDTCEYQDGQCVDTHGAWEWGVDGALPGVVMWAAPTPNRTAYFQEFYWPEALDEAAVWDTGARVQTPVGVFTDTLTTREWTRLSSGYEVVHYARGVGVVWKGPPGEPMGGEALVDYGV